MLFAKCPDTSCLTQRVYQTPQLYCLEYTSLKLPEIPYTLVSKLILPDVQCMVIHLSQCRLSGITCPAVRPIWVLVKVLLQNTAEPGPH